MDRYIFTAPENRWVAEARMEYERRLSTIMQINQLQGIWMPTPENDGLVQTQPTNSKAADGSDKV
jgi:hypothetical protein